jgi:hypothetical protein
VTSSTFHWAALSSGGAATASLLAFVTPALPLWPCPCLSQPPPLPLTVTFSLFVWLLLPLLAVVLLIDLATMGTERRAQMLRRSGLSQAAIAQRLGISRYRVRLALA